MGAVEPQKRERGQPEGLAPFSAVRSPAGECDDYTGQPANYYPSAANIHDEDA